jgi:hypothetical protein
MKLKVGDRLGLAGQQKVLLAVVGIVHKPEVLAQHLQTVYVPLKVLQRVQGWDEASPNGPQVNR